MANVSSISTISHLLSNIIAFYCVRNTFQLVCSFQPPCYIRCLNQWIPLDRIQLKVEHMRHIYLVIGCTERMLDGDSPFVRIDATSSKPGTEPEDALLQESPTCWQPDEDDESIPTLTLTILSDGNALVTDIMLSVKGVSMVEVEYLPSSFTPVSK